MRDRWTLLVANSRDFATDYVVAELRARGRPYLRLDTDLLHQDRVCLDPVCRRLSVDGPQGPVALGADDIGGVYFRAPTHLSESGGNGQPPAERLARHQWTAFTRSLTVFRDCRWVNHPVATFAAEAKPYQLTLAAGLGFDVLPTMVTNAAPPEDWCPDEDQVAIKALDTFLVREGEANLFFYTQAVPRATIGQSLSEMPVIVQRYARPKVDLRVTVVGPSCVAVAIRGGEEPIEGDWRILKDTVAYHLHALPADIEQRCVRLVAELGLRFGAIDLLFDPMTHRYSFLEINPTGEWAWLAHALSLPIAAQLVDVLTGTGTGTEVS